jgi:hypothetical protein
MRKERFDRHEDASLAPSPVAAPPPGRVMRTALHRDAGPAAEIVVAGDEVVETPVLIAHDVPVTVQRFAFSTGGSYSAGVSLDPGGGGGGAGPLPTSWHEDEEEEDEKKDRKAQHGFRGGARKPGKAKKHGFGVHPEQE